MDESPLPDDGRHEARGEAVALLLAMCPELLDLLRDKDLRTHVTVFRLFGELTAEEVVDNAPGLQGIYPLLSSYVHDELEARCPAWRIFRPLHPAGADIPLLNEATSALLAEEAELWLARQAA